MTDVKGTPNDSEAAIAFGFGETIFPDFPPPIIAINIDVFEILTLFARAIAIGDTVITDMSTNTPTAVSTNVDITKANIALFSPSLSTIVSAILLAAPVSISTPAKIPAVIIRKMAGIIPCAPLIMKLTVSTRPVPPRRPPIRDPNISE